jgi:putative ABC transport system permease protein
MNFLESIYIAFDSVKSNKIRASLTLLSISIGVFAIIGAGTLVSSINNAVVNEMAGLGETTFSISRMPAIVNGPEWHKYAKRKTITYSQFNSLKKKITNAEYVSSQTEDNGKTVKSGALSTDPDVSLVGSDENYLLTASNNIKTGREINAEDVTYNRNVAVIGNDLVVKLFPNTTALGKKITIENQSFEIIGVLESKGAVMGQSQDNLVVIPISQYLKYYSSEWTESLTITIRAKNKEVLNRAIDDAIAEFRVIRNLKPWIENDFEITTNESISEQFSSFTKYLSYFGFACGLMSLIAAGVGIMNIMLVSVKERTREIGIRKAIGAKNRSILMQFIVETITLCQIGGFMGIVAGIGGAWLLSLQLNLQLIFPTVWVIVAILVCTLLGLVSGLYPAWKAAKLDPIESLRYE